MRKRSKPGGRGSKGMTHTVCYTDEHWQAIVEGARRAGMSVSAWWVHCVENVDPSPKGKKAQPLVLDEGRQRAILDGVTELARGLDADGEAVRQVQDDIRALLEEPLRKMACEGRRERAMELLCEVLGEERAAVVAEAFMPEAEGAPETPQSPAGPGDGDGWIGGDLARALAASGDPGDGLNCGGAGMRHSKQRCFYCSPEVWERIRRRARKAKLKRSRFLWLCCRQAAEGDPRARQDPAGHPLVLTEEEQRRLRENARRLSGAGHFAVGAPGGVKAVVKVGEAVRLLHLADREHDA